MKRIGMLLAVIVFMSTSQVSARAPLSAQETFHESGALMLVLDAIYDASFDFEGVYIVTHNIEFLTEKKECEVVETQALVDHFKKIFQEFISYYPDEQLPYDEALDDLREIAGGSEFKHCYERMENARGYVEVTHYKSLDSKLWVRIEYNVRH